MLTRRVPIHLSLAQNSDKSILHSLPLLSYPYRTVSFQRYLGPSTVRCPIDWRRYSLFISRSSPILSTAQSDPIRNLYRQLTSKYGFVSRGITSSILVTNLSVSLFFLNTVHTNKLDMFCFKTEPLLMSLLLHRLLLYYHNYLSNIVVSAFMIIMIIW